MKQSSLLKTGSEFCMMKKNATRSPGFTFIEIIVVCSIIIIMLAMIVSRVAGLRDKAFLGSCANNMRIIVRALHLYIEDYHCAPTGANAKELYGYLYYPETKKGHIGGITALKAYVCPATQHLPPTPSSGGYGLPLNCTALKASSQYSDPKYTGSSIDYWVIAKQNGTGWLFPDLTSYPACNVILWEASDLNYTHHTLGRNLGYWNESVRFYPYNNFNASKYPYNVDDNGNPESVSILDAARFVDPEAAMT
jgi:type II secretory pathway pseudopilin PulG